MLVFAPAADTRFFSPFSADLGSPTLPEGTAEHLKLRTPVGGRSLIPRGGVNLGGSTGMVVGVESVPTFNDPREADTL